MTDIEEEQKEKLNLELQRLKCENARLQVENKKLTETMMVIVEELEDLFRCTQTHLKSGQNGYWHGLGAGLKSGFCQAVHPLSKPIGTWINRVMR